MTQEDRDKLWAQFSEMLDLLQGEFQVLKSKRPWSQARVDWMAHAHHMLNQSTESLSVVGLQPLDVFRPMEEQVRAYFVYLSDLETMNISDDDSD